MAPTTKWPTMVVQHRGGSALGQTLKVAYILREFPSISETFILREMYWIRQQGIEVHIYALFPPPDHHSPIHKQARELLPVTHYSAYLNWEVIKAQFCFLGRSPFRYLRALSKTIWHTCREPGVLLRALAIFPKSVRYALQMEEAGIRHVHAHFVWLEAISASIVTDLLDITFSICPHAFGLFRRNHRDLRLQLENASQVVTVSAYNQAYIDGLCPHISADGVELVRCGLEANRWQPPSRPKDNRPVQILSLGRLIRKKGHAYLIDACALLAEQGIAFQCRIIGEGRGRKQLQAHIARRGLQGHVMLVGALDQGQVLRLCQASDIFVLACVTAQDGDQDGIPVALMEAMACELPVVTTPVAGIPELVRDGETGLLVEQRDVAGLAGAIECLIVDQGMRERLGKRARQTILSQFEIQRNVTKLAALFRRVSDQHPKQPDGVHTLFGAPLNRLGVALRNRRN